MKRILAIILSAALLCICSYSFAEVDIDLEEMSYEELIELRDKIDLELHKQGSDAASNLIYEGEYIAGQNIRIGDYFFTTVSKDDASVYIYKTLDGIPDYRYFAEETGETFLIQLAEGMKIQVYGVFSVEEAPSFTWKP